MMLLPAGYQQQVNGKTADVSSELMKNNFDAVTGGFIFKCDWTVHPISESPKIKLRSQQSLISAQINLVLIKSKPTSTFVLHETFFVCRLHRNRLVLIELKPVPFECILFWSKQVIRLERMLVIDLPVETQFSLFQSSPFDWTRFDSTKTNLSCISKWMVLWLLFVRSHNRRKHLFVFSLMLIFTQLFWD